MPMLRVCTVDDCSTKTLGERCLEHERKDRSPAAGGSARQEARGGAAAHAGRRPPVDLPRQGILLALVGVEAAWVVALGYLLHNLVGSL
jgi:hypothetical protein